MEAFALPSCQAVSDGLDWDEVGLAAVAVQLSGGSLTQVLGFCGSELAAPATLL